MQKNQERQRECISFLEERDLGAGYWSNSNHKLSSSRSVYVSAVKAGEGDAWRVGMLLCMCHMPRSDYLNRLASSLLECLPS
jgi:hypothetical protein